LRQFFKLSLLYQVGAKYWLIEEKSLPKSEPSVPREVKRKASGSSFLEAKTQTRLVYL
jgi:hypothetical protein